MSLLKGTAFITGAASGIGRSTALAFARHGIQNLALADRNGEALAAAVAQLQADFPHVAVLPLQMDVERGSEVQAAVAAAAARFGRLDVAVNNAGISGSGKPTHEVDEAEWRRIVNVDLDGVWRCQSEEIKVLLKQENRGPREGRGRIINMASMFGISVPGSHHSHTAYAAAKHGVVGLTRGDATTYGPHGIRINAVCPGYVETPLLAVRRADAEGSPLWQDIQRTPLQRMAQPEEIADAVAFLASPLSSFMQGAALVADGGFSV